MLLDSSVMFINIHEFVCKFSWTHFNARSGNKQEKEGVTSFVYNYYIYIKKTMAPRETL